MTIKFATDRNQYDDKDNRFFGPEFRPAGDKYRYVTGTIDVEKAGDDWRLIPGTRKIKNGYGAMSTKNVKLLSDASTDPVLIDFLGLEAQVTGGQVKTGIFFVGGFNNSFAAHISSAASIAEKLKDPNILCFSWPSVDGGPSKYDQDYKNAYRAGPNLASSFGNVILKLASLAGSREISLLVHSMGARVLSTAVQALGSTPQHKQLLSTRFSKKRY